MIEDHTRELYVTNVELERKNKDIEQFVYAASHDLQEPLRTVIGYVQFLKSRYKNEIDQDALLFMRYIEDSTMRMAGLIRGLLEYSKLGNKKETVTVNCNAVINDVCDDLSAFITDKKAELRADHLPEIMGHETEIRLLFQNLVSNGIKFHRKDTNPVIHVSAIQENGLWKFSFKDNGIGIADKDREKVFIIFERLNHRTEFEGHGIGLAHCRKIVELHGGKIWVESVPGEGSTFYFTIPGNRNSEKSANIE